jgi:hypothetical protein
MKAEVIVRALRAEVENLRLDYRLTDNPVESDIYYRLYESLGRVADAIDDMSGVES